MNFELKTLSPDAVPRAIEKAMRYRLLNEPGEAASICLDALAADAHNQEALTTLLLALTDQFEDSGANAVAEALLWLEQIAGEYERAYYSGIVAERRARARLRLDLPDAGARAYEWLSDAMASYERAEAIRPPGNDDALLRWNACARLMMRDRRIAPAVEERTEPLFLE